MILRTAIQATMLLLWLPVATAQTCGDVVLRSTTLAADVVCPPGSTVGLSVQASDVILDLGGHRILMGGSGTGVEVRGVDRVVVTGGSVLDTTVGVALHGSALTQVRYLRLQARQAAIDIRGSRAAYVAGNLLVGGDGVRVDAWPADPALRSDQLTIKTNVFRHKPGYLSGAVLQASIGVDDLVAIDNDASNWEGDGFHVRGERGILMDNHVAVTDLAGMLFTNPGVHWKGGANAHIRGNVFEGFKLGLKIDGTKAQVYDNWVTAREIGAEIEGRGNHLYCNQFKQSGLHWRLSTGGVHLTFSSRDNHVHDNGFTGFDADLLDGGVANVWSLGEPNCP